MLSAGRVKAWAVVALMGVMSGCGGGGGGGTPSGGGGEVPIASTTLSGVASKGRVAQGIVTAYKLVDGAQGDPLATARTQGAAEADPGAYNLEWRNWTGPVLIEVRADAQTQVKSEIDDTFLSVPADRFKLRAALPAATGSTVTAHITPFSEMAVASLPATGGLTQALIEKANAAVSQQVAGVNFLNTRPPASKDELQNKGADSAEALLFLGLAGIERAARDSDCTGDTGEQVACMLDRLGKALRTEADGTVQFGTAEGQKAIDAFLTGKATMTEDTRVNRSAITLADLDSAYRGLQDRRDSLRSGSASGAVPVVPPDSRDEVAQAKAFMADLRSTVRGYADVFEATDLNAGALGRLSQNVDKALAGTGDFLPDLVETLATAVRMHEDRDPFIRSVYSPARGRSVYGYAAAFGPDRSLSAPSSLYSAMRNAAGNNLGASARGGCTPIIAVAGTAPLVNARGRDLTLLSSLPDGFTGSEPTLGVHCWLPVSQPRSTGQSCNGQPQFEVDVVYLRLARRSDSTELYDATVSKSMPVLTGNFACSINSDAYIQATGLSRGNFSTQSVWFAGTVRATPGDTGTRSFSAEFPTLPGQGAPLGTPDSRLALQLNGEASESSTPSSGGGAIRFAASLVGTPLNPAYPPTTITLSDGSLSAAAASQDGSLSNVRLALKLRAVNADSSLEGEVASLRSTLISGVENPGRTLLRDSAGKFTGRVDTLIADGKRLRFEGSVEKLASASDGTYRQIESGLLIGKLNIDGLRPVDLTLSLSAKEQANGDIDMGLTARLKKSDFSALIDLTARNTLPASGGRTPTSFILRNQNGLSVEGSLGDQRLSILDRNKAELGFIERSSLRITYRDNTGESLY